jgi:hypothetical protein
MVFAAPADSRKLCALNPPGVATPALSAFRLGLPAFTA